MRIPVHFPVPVLLALLLSAPPASAARLDCGPVTNKETGLPRTVAIGTNPAGTGAHAIASGLAAVASKKTPIGAKVQPYNGPNAWIPLLESGEIEMGIINILDSYMAATGTGNYKKPHPGVRIISGGVFPFTVGLIVRDKSDIKQVADLKGKRLAWDYGGHAINQTWQNAALEAAGLKPSDVVPVRVSNLNDGIRAVPEGKVDASFTGVGIGIIEEVNAMEPIRFLSIPNDDAARKIMDRYGASIVKSAPATGIRGETYVIGYPLQLAGSSKVSEKTVYTLVKAWWENLPELQSIHPLFKRWTKETQAITNFTVPYHPGAISFYKEVGAWTARHEARMKEICR
ncbi:MAG TPA: TAXI family TRAP transporter solute-binding subunit [candidate division Zixibacteria bacterium]|nr:TAXI family TRAP transporter solute-binding subunit [candidate division Zixibacteria bacterium]